VGERAGTAHQNLSCVNCHEANGLFGSLTTALPLRLAHITVGTFTQEGVPGYSGFAQDSCRSCHAVRLESTISSSEGLRVSHRGIVKSGIPCGDCHVLAEDSGELAIARNSMQTCASCHYSQGAGVSCATCHKDGSQYVSQRQTDPSADFARTHMTAELLNPREMCYRCHATGPCDDCHGGIRMPHPTPGYALAPHAGEAEQYGSQACLTCHTKGFCLNCHGDAAEAGF